MLAQATTLTTLSLYAVAVASSAYYFHVGEAGHQSMRHRHAVETTRLVASLQLHPAVLVLFWAMRDSPTPEVAMTVAAQLIMTLSAVHCQIASKSIIPALTTAVAVPCSAYLLFNIRLMFRRFPQARHNTDWVPCEAIKTSAMLACCVRPLLAILSPLLPALTAALVWLAAEAVVGLLLGRCLLHACTVPLLPQGTGPFPVHDPDSKKPFTGPPSSPSAPHSLRSLLTNLHASLCTFLTTSTELLASHNVGAMTPHLESVRSSAAACLDLVNDALHLNLLPQRPSSPAPTPPTTTTTTTQTNLPESPRTTTRNTLSLPPTTPTPATPIPSASPAKHVALAPLNLEAARDCATDDTEAAASEISPAASPTAGRTGVPRLPQLRVLYASDQELDLQVMHSLLSAAGVKGLQTAYSAEEALELLDAAEALPHVVLLDVLLPGMDGFEACREILARHTGSDIRVILVSADARQASADAALACGASSFLPKPLLLQDLLPHLTTPRPPAPVPPLPTSTTTRQLHLAAVEAEATASQAASPAGAVEASALNLVIPRPTLGSPSILPGTPGKTSAMLHILETAGLAHLAPQFQAEDVTPSLLPFLTDADMQRMGATTIGARMRLRRAAAKEMQ